MSKWTFFGRVLPERVPITWNTPLEGLAKSSHGFSFRFQVAIHHSQIVVDIDIMDAAPDLASLRNCADDLARTITDLVAYRAACHFDVEIVSAVCQETNVWTVFGINIPVLANRKTPECPINGQLMMTIAGSIPASIVLASFREAMRVPVATGFFCYRAIEAMMQSMKFTPKENDRPAWERLRAMLCIDRSAIDEIKQHADLPRHGKPSAITDAERVAVFVLADEIIRRFLEYLCRGETALPSDEFPMLKSA